MVVNAKNLMATGRKKEQKMYRYHTGYFGGFRETNMRLLLEKDASKVIYFAVRGMIPKSKHRENIIKTHLYVNDGPVVQQYNFHLPNFTESDPIDINDYFGLKTVSDPDKWEIMYETHPEKTPEELSKLDKNIDENWVRSSMLTPKTHTEPKSNLF